MNIKIYLIVILICTIVVVSLAGFVYITTWFDGKFTEGQDSNVPYVASTYVKNAKFTEDGIIFEYETTDADGNVTVSEKTSEEMAKIEWQNLVKSKSNITHYLSSYQNFEKFMNAEIITQFPKLDKDVELNGTIEFERNMTDGSKIKLKYINKELFEKYIDEKNLDVVNYYTMDENGNILIGVVNETTEELTSNDGEMNSSDYTDTLNASNKLSDGTYKKTEYVVTSKSISYKLAISNYTMPFQYLWSLLVVGGDEEFVLELADLVEESQIVISIYDNITTTVDTTVNTYTREKKVDVFATARTVSNYGSVFTSSKTFENADEWKENEYSITHTYTYKDNSVIVDVTKANVWIVDYSKDYTYKSGEQTSKTENEIDQEDTEYTADAENPVESNDGSDLPEYSRFKGKLDELKSDLEKRASQSVMTEYDEYGEPITYIVSSYISMCRASYYKHNIDRKEKNTSVTYSQEYVAGDVTNNPKVEKDSAEKNFVTLLLDIKHNDAMKRYTKEVTNWLMKLLENNPDTVNMVDLTSYLLYKTTGDGKKFNDSYDFSIYANSQFSFSSGGIYSGTIQEKVWFALKDLGYSDIAVAGAMGNIHYESRSFDPSRVEKGYTEKTGGIGICQWTNNNRGKTGRNTNLRKYAESKGTTWQDENIQVAFLVGELTKGGGADGFASYQLMTTTKVYGSSLATSKSWKNAENIEDATRAFCYTFERPGANYAASSMATRISYAQMYYNQYQGMTAPEEIDTTLTGENKEKMQLMIAEARRIANDDRYQYSQSNRNAEFFYDCSSFVSRLYQQYFGISRLDYGTAGKGTDNIKTNCQTFSVSMTNLQPGDILWKNGHVALYIGNNQLVEAMNEKRGIVISTYSANRFTYAFRIIK